MGEDAAEVVGDAAHDETVEQGDPPFAPGARQDASGWQEAEILQRLIEGQLPLRRICLGRRERTRDPTPGILNRDVDRGAVGRLQAVLRVPDLARNRRDAVGRS